MCPFQKSEIHTDVFTLEEINLLRQDQNSRAVAVRETNTNVHNKNLDYHLPNSIVHKIVKPKLDRLFGTDHEFSTGAYKEAWTPYATHVDNWDFHRHHYSFTDNKQKYNCAVLIPLSEDPEFRTVIFDAHSDADLGMGQPLPEKFLTSSNDLNLNWFTHIKEPTRQQIPKLALDKVFNWKIGNLVIWARSALHCSSDFAKFGLCKRFIVIFIA